ncbi:MAG: S41 family peptidase [Pseudomonadota bacterium]
MTFNLRPFRLVSALALSAYILVGCRTGPDVFQRDEWHALTVAGTTQRLSGVWRNQTLGHVAVFDTDGVKVYHQLADSCIPDTGVVPAFTIVRETGPDQVELFYYDYRKVPDLLQNPLEYSRLDNLPKSCVAGGSEWQLIDVFDHAWDLFNAHYAFFDEQGVDWSALRALYRPLAVEAGTESELFDVLAKMLGHLNDSHVNLVWKARSFNAGKPRLRAKLQRAWEESDRSVSDGAFVGQWARTVQASIVDVLDSGSYGSGANGAFEWGTIGDTGYLRINRFYGFSAEPQPRQEQLEGLRTTLSDAANELRRTDRLIVDVAHNGGGNDAAAMTAAAMFMDTRRDVFQYSAPYSTTKVVSLSPTRLFHQQDVLLVTSEITVSAAEAFVLMMRTLPYVEHVGGSTRGALSGLLPKPLPRDFRVTISYQSVRDAQGRLFEATGIPPERPIELFPENDLFNGYLEAILGLAAAGTQ